MQELSLIPTNKLRAGPNPRINFAEEPLQFLADDIKKRGIIQPILATPDGMIIAGERRWRAAKLAELKEVPVIFKDTEEIQELALIENLQREDLTSIEEGRAYKQLLILYACTQKELAQKLNITESAITERLKLLTLPKKAQQFVTEGKISFSHAKALFGLNKKDTEELIQDIIKKGSNVKDTKKKAAEKKNKEQKCDPDKLFKESKKKISKARILIDDVLENLELAAEGCSEEADKFLLADACEFFQQADSKLEQFLKGN